MDPQTDTRKPIRLFRPRPFRDHPWSSSWLARGLYAGVGVKKPQVLTIEEWEKWRRVTQAEYPTVYVLVETVLDRVQDVVMAPLDVLDRLRRAGRNRFIERTHLLRTGLPPWEYHEIDTRILHGLFTTLVDYVEIELAWMQTLSHRDDPPRWRFRRRPWGRRPRSAEDGLAYLAWETTLDDPGLADTERSPRQAQDAREILALYRWWTAERPARADPYEASGWSAYCARNPIPAARDKEEVKPYLDALAAIEGRYAAEDEAMLVRLVKIRTGLWT